MKKSIYAVFYRLVLPAVLLSGCASTSTIPTTILPTTTPIKSLPPSPISPTITPDPIEDLISVTFTPPPKTATPTKVKNVNAIIIIDGLPDDWADTGCTEIIDEEKDLIQLTGVSKPQTAQWIDYKRVCYFSQSEKIYVLMEFYGEINQNNPETKLIGYGVSFREEPKFTASSIIYMNYIPDIGADLYLFRDNAAQGLGAQGVKAAYNKNYIEIEIPIKIIQNFFSNPYLNYSSYRNINNHCQTAARLICSFRYGDAGYPRYSFQISLNP